MKPVVALVKGEDPEKSTKEAMDYLGGMEAIVPQGATVMIKPNFTAARTPETGAASDPTIAKQLVQLAIEAGASKVILAEGMGASHVSLGDVKGLREISEMKGVEVIDLNDEPTEVVNVPEHLAVDRFEIPPVVLECDVFINLAKLKVHPQSMLSLSMKNLLGTLPGRAIRDAEEAKRQGYLTPIVPGGGKKIFHDLARDLGTEAMQDAIVDLNTLIRSHLNVIDGLYGMEGRGAPVRGKPVKMDLLIAGTDIVAVESVGAAVMGFEPESLPYLKKAFEKGVGSEYRVDEIEIRGANLESVRRKFEQADMAALWRKQEE